MVKLVKLLENIENTCIASQNLYIFALCVDIFTSKLATISRCTVNEIFILYAEFANYDLEIAMECLKLS